jgi:alkylation response protein AidB-like acyl-CoA dehydrogenase
MNFDLSDEQQMIVDAVAKYVDKDSPVERFRKLRDTETGWETKAWRSMGEYGWLGVAYPEEQGGFGGSFVDTALILEQLGRGLVPEPFIASVVLAGGLVSRLGTAEQVERVLAPMIAGETTLALAYAETQSRYDLFDCGTKAEKSGGGYKITGEKVWVLNGHAADAYVVVARTAGDRRDESGLSLFIVEASADGLSRTRVSCMDGQSAGLIKLDGVEVAAENLLGEEGAALSELEWASDRGAAAACAEAQGCLSELLDRTVEYLKDRKQFGRAIGTFQALQHRAADMFAEVQLCQGSMYLAAISADSDDRETRIADVSVAKTQLTRGGWFVQENAVQLFGGIAITDEQDTGLFFKRVRVLQGLFGDADHHIARYEMQPRFEAAGD